jgi:hypothetical protein
MNRFVVSLLILTTVFYTSCMCLQGAVGIVYDAETNQPISNVLVTTYEDENEIQFSHTLSDGAYDTGEKSASCVETRVSFQKEGYTITSIWVPGGDIIDGQDIYLVKSN